MVSDASVIEPVEGAEQFVESFLRHSGSEIGYANHGFVLAVSNFSVQANFDVGAVMRVPHGVAHHVLDGAVQQRRTSENRDLFLDGATHVALTTLRFEVGVLGDVANQFIE